MTDELHDTEYWQQVPSSLKEKVEESHQVLNGALDEHDPILVWPMFSGGHDSLVTTHLVTSLIRSDQVVHINTGIGIEKTRQFVRETCSQYGWELLEYKAEDYLRGDGEPDPQIYEELVLEYGFPGPPMHQKMYDRLKGRPLRQAVREHKEEWMDRIMLCTGIRQDESLRRMGLDSVVDRDGAKLWVNPIFSWTAKDCQKYMGAFDLPRNEVKEVLCMSGECLCGAFAKEGELQQLEAYCPEVGERIRELEEKARDAGFPWGWEERRPEWYDKWKKGEQFIPGTEPEDATPQMCTSCGAKYERYEETYGFGAEEGKDDDDNED